jgi:alpha-2-macroglobulin
VLLHSDRRADGVLLEALIGDQKESDLIPKLVTGLLGHRKAGRWTSTQENAFILLALDRYFQTYEKVTPNFVGRAWVGEKLALEQTFQGRSTDRQHVAVPLSVLASLVTPRGTDLVLQKDGAGRMYYRVGMSYAPSDLRPPPAEHGFSLTRLYEAVDAPSDVRRDPDGTYRIKAGANVRVRVNMVAPARRHHVALVDPLPAGLEPLNPALATTGSIPEDPSAAPNRKGAPFWWTRTWYEHQNMRDERVEAFTSLLYDGVYEYTYVASATTPGVFVAPPPKAEEMYSPETFGRGAGDRVIVE